MISLSDFLPSVQIEAPGCPKALMLDAIRHAVREFCDRSKVWSEDLDEISLYANYSVYDIDIPLGTSLVALTARYKGEPISVLTSDEMDEENSQWRNDTGTDITAIIVDNSSEFRVYPSPTADDASAILLRASLKPSMTATTCGDVLADWYEAIKHGALQRLKAMPKKAWTDQASVPYHNNEFEKEINAVIAKVIRGYSTAPLRTKAYP